MAVQPRTEIVTIYTGDHLSRLRHVEQQWEAAQEAENQSPLRGGEKSEAARLAEEHARLRAEAEETAVHVKVGTVRRSVYRTLADAHKPREGNEGDKALGVNASTFREALVPEAVVEVTEGGSTRPWAEYAEDDRTDFLDMLAESDFERLFATAYGLVNGFVGAPKALRDSQPTPENSAI